MNILALVNLHKTHNGFSYRINIYKSLVSWYDYVYTRNHGEVKTLDEKKVIVPFKVERAYKNKLLDHCRKEGMTLSGLIRKLLREYAEKEGIEQ